MVIKNFKKVHVCVQYFLHTFMLNMLLGMVSFILGCGEVNNSKDIAMYQSYTYSNRLVLFEFPISHPDT